MATYTKLRDGSWGIKGQGLKEGQTALVTKRSGETAHERIGKILWVGDDGTTIATISLASGVSTSPARRKGTAFGPRRKACINGGDCSSYGSGRSCGGYDCDGH